MREEGLDSDDLAVAHLDVIGELLVKLDLARASLDVHAP
jgi:hypothetical protein